MKEKEPFKITEHEAALLERIADATKLDNFFYITEDLVAKDAEGDVNTPEEAVCLLEDGLGYSLTEPQSGGLSEEEAKEVEAVFRRARYACCKWKKFSARVYIEDAEDVFQAYTIEGQFEEGVFLNLDDAPSDTVLLRISHHSEERCFPFALTANKYQGIVNFFGTAMIDKSQLPAEVVAALKADKRLIVFYDRDEESDNGVGDGHLFPDWDNL